jgi:hypothetical protein
MTIEWCLLVGGPLVALVTRLMFLWKSRLERARTMSAAQLAHALPPGASVTEYRADGSTLVVARHEWQATPARRRRT